MSKRVHAVNASGKVIMTSRCNNMKPAPCKYDMMSKASPVGVTRRTLLQIYETVENYPLFRQVVRPTHVQMERVI